MADRKPSEHYRRRPRKSGRHGGQDSFNSPLAWGDPAADSLTDMATPRPQQASFITPVSPDEVRREKEQARALKKTRWWQRQLERGVCFYCQKAVGRDQVTLDHIVPLIRGGRSTRSNIVLACKTCNSRKKYLLPMEWEEYLRQVRSSGGQDANLPTPADDDEEPRDA